MVFVGLCIPPCLLLRGAVLAVVQRLISSNGHSDTLGGLDWFVVGLLVFFTFVR